MYFIDLIITSIHTQHCVLVFDCSLVYTATLWLPVYCYKVQTELDEGKEKTGGKKTSIKSLCE